MSTNANTSYNANKLPLIFLLSHSDFLHDLSTPLPAHVNATNSHDGPSAHDKRTFRPSSRTPYKHPQYVN